MIADTFTFTSKDNVPFHTYKWFPEKKECKAVVQILHGMAEHAGRYGDFARALTEKGYGVYAHDYRGHGKTAQSPKDLGYLGENIKFDCLIRDGYQLTEIIKKTHAGVPVILFGHSIGAYIALGYSEDYGKAINGCIFAGPGYPARFLVFAGKIIVKREIKKYGENHKSITGNKLTFGAYNKQFRPNRTPFDWLNRDNDVIDAYMKDPLCGFIYSSSYYYELAQWVTTIFTKENISKVPDTLPLFLIGGSKDPVGNNGKDILKLYRIYNDLGIKDVKKKIYPHTRHELLHELNKREVLKDILTWLEDRYGTR